MADSLQERKSLFVAGIKPLLKTEQSNTVKKYMSLVIISMAQHDYLSLEGGEEILEWVCLNCAIPNSVVAEWEEKQAAKKKVAGKVRVVDLTHKAGKERRKQRKGVSCPSAPGLRRSAAARSFDHSSHGPGPLAVSS